MKTICPILGRETEVDTTRYGKDHWSIVRCRESGFVFLKAPPDYSRLETEFAWEKTSEEERYRRESIAPLMASASRISKRTKTLLFPTRNKIASTAFRLLISRSEQGTPMTVLDVGCSQGSLLLELHRRCTRTDIQIVPMGIEVSRDLASEAKKRTECIGGKIAFSNALDGVKALDSCSIHLAILCSFLEHESQPLLFLKQLYRTLTPNGEVLIKVPNFSSWNRKIRNRSWSGFRFPDHVNYFTPETLKRLAQQAGFHGFRQRMIDRLPFSDNMYAVLEKAP